MRSDLRSAQLNSTLKSSVLNELSFFMMVIMIKIFRLSIPLLNFRAYFLFLIQLKHYDSALKTFRG